MPSSIQFPGTSGRPTRNRQKDDEGILGEGAILRLSREAGETLPTSHPLTVQIARAESHKS